MISLKHKFIYTHPQKTGGTSIESFFKISDNLIVPKHGSLQQYIDKLNCKNIDASTYLKISSTRNPWDSALSHFFYDKKIIKKLKATKQTLNSRYLRINKFKNFDEYVKSGVYYGGGIIHYMCCGETVKDFCIDYVIRFENLQDDFNKACDMIGLPHKMLPHINKTKHDHYTEYYNDETKRLVAEKYAEDIEFFDYKFGQ